MSLRTSGLTPLIKRGRAGVETQNFASLRRRPDFFPAEMSQRDLVDGFSGSKY
jgi:hypothetical protein